MNYSELLNRAYEAYKLDWCIARGVQPEDVDEEVGIDGGQCYVCREEFEACEFQDSSYMTELLSQNYFLEWLRLVDAPMRGPKFTAVWEQSFSQQEQERMLEQLVSSKSPGERQIAASLGYGLGRLIFDEAFQVRCECARQGAGVNVLAKDPEPAVRCELAKAGYALETLMHDKNAFVRAEVVQQGYKLDEMIKDSNELVRWNVALMGYGLDALAKDKAPSVVQNVRAILKDSGLSLEDWIQLNPDKCVLPENHKISLDAAISQADAVRSDRGQAEPMNKGKDSRDRD